CVTLSCLLFFFTYILPTPPRSTLFPYTTLFRSALEQAGTAAIRSAAVEQLVREAALHVRGNLGKKIGDKEQEIERMIKQTDRARSEEHTSELQSRENLVCRLLLEKKKKNINTKQ